MSQIGWRETIYHGCLYKSLRIGPPFRSINEMATDNLNLEGVTAGMSDKEWESLLLSIECASPEHLSPLTAADQHLERPSPPTTDQALSDSTFGFSPTPSANSYFFSSGSLRPPRCQATPLDISQPFPQLIAQIESRLRTMDDFSVNMEAWAMSLAARMNEIIGNLNRVRDCKVNQDQ
ncbi:uncharacterized protein BDZ99DRAFT_243235 [Mytilinidion resinicola]|uniref:Uncharacterized protein n=1 Tax=Mytilinidion resinicola TaxID=574789 RepID=A0A6A6YY01_9PEZI|nr:uncharacterized protein BDZ99DRAFT_243235 [Mytilinidion resinicola]KAF2812817.1 hypothetical protein BDZ99DRAFT_243235 [Mytilinidion resinicola]